MNRCYFWSLTFQPEGETMRDEDKIVNNQKSLYMCMKLLISLKLHLGRLKKHIIRRHGVAHLWPSPRRSASPSVTWRAGAWGQPMHTNQMSPEWASVYCLWLLMIGWPALCIFLDFILRTDRASYFKRQYLLLFAFDLKRQEAKLFIKVHQMTLIQLWK